MIVKVGKKSHALMGLIGSSVVLFVVALTITLSAATSPAYKLQTTFYDFHENGSNPEFNTDDGLYRGGTPGRGLVMNTLNAQRKPVRNMAIPTDSMYRVEHVAKWFVGWTPGSPDTFMQAADTIYSIKDSVYGCDSSIFLALGGDDPSLIMCGWSNRYDTTYIPAGPVISDTLFKNVTVNDSLRFVLAPETVSTVVTNWYRLKANDSLNNRDFFAMDGKGFEAQGYPRFFPGTHNYSFTFELHNQFVYHGGEKLYLGGDDDIWVFINNNLTIDLGGFHAYQADTIALGDLGLTVGQTYNFDMFFCERHIWGSNLFIKTDMDFVNKRTYVDSGQSVEVNRNGGVVRSGQHSKLLTLAQGINVVVPVATNDISFSIVDCTGKIVARKSGENSLQHFDNLPKGVYVINIACFNNQHKVIGVVLMKTVSIK